MHKGNLDGELTIAEVYKGLETLINSTSDSVKQELKNSISELTSTLEAANRRIHELEKENKSLQKQLETQNRELKKNNIVIFGLEEEENENLYGKITHFFHDKLKIDTNKSEIVNAYRFGTSTPRVTVVKFVSYHKKVEITKNGKLLKGTQYAIANDLTKNEQDTQKVLRKHLNKARQQNLPTKIVRNKLLIESTLYTAEELKELDTDKNITNETTHASTSRATNENDLNPAEPCTLSTKPTTRGNRNIDGKETRGRKGDSSTNRNQRR